MDRGMQVASAHQDLMMHCEELWGKIDRRRLQELRQGGGRYPCVVDLAWTSNCTGSSHPAHMPDVQTEISNKTIMAIEIHQAAHPIESDLEAQQPASNAHAVDHLDGMAAAMEPHHLQVFARSLDFRLSLWLRALHHEGWPHDCGQVVVQPCKLLATLCNLLDRPAPAKSFMTIDGMSGMHGMHHALRRL